MKHVRYAIEALGVYLLYGVFRLMPARMASDFGGWLARLIGPRLAASRKARRNLDQALPELANKDQVVVDMWENMGRVFAEYPHLQMIARQHVTVEGRDVLERLFDSGMPAILFGGHIGNWEICSATLFEQFDRHMDLTYRAPNNPWVEALLKNARTLNGRFNAYTKSQKGGRAVMNALKNGHYVGILIDQKYNEGLSVPFFDMPAMTNPIAVQLAQKFKCPLIPVQCVRVSGCKFKLIIHEPLQIFNENNPLPVEEVLKKANAMLEGWIRENPGQWIWLHKRWDSAAFKSD